MHHRKSSWVKGHYRNGTWISPHYRNGTYVSDYTRKSYYTHKIKIPNRTPILQDLSDKYKVERDRNIYVTTVLEREKNRIKPPVYESYFKGTFEEELAFNRSHRLWSIRRNSVDIAEKYLARIIGKSKANLLKNQTIEKYNKYLEEHGEIPFHNLNDPELIENHVDNNDLEQIESDGIKKAYNYVKNAAKRIFHQSKPLDNIRDNKLKDENKTIRVDNDEIIGESKPERRAETPTIANKLDKRLVSDKELDLSNPVIQRDRIIYIITVLVREKNRIKPPVYESYFKGTFAEHLTLNRQKAKRRYPRPGDIDSELKYLARAIGEYGMGKAKLLRDQANEQYNRYYLEHKTIPTDYIG